ncbi:hypothetical protein E2C01_032086 [Portunus trituberculatus]|uniref:Uncharacterized protein n=1 Tax=Portunus trituberculatus TaxID=210409 RepID=A0A5B7F009_PORTR|nr:hypothetical protein [Portunus trituberculatus]
MAPPGLHPKLPAQGLAEGKETEAGGAELGLTRSQDLPSGIPELSEGEHPRPLGRHCTSLDGLEGDPPGGSPSQQPYTFDLPGPADVTRRLRHTSSSALSSSTSSSPSFCAPSPHCKATVTGK